MPDPDHDNGTTGDDLDADLGAGSAAPSFDAPELETVGDRYKVVVTLDDDGAEHAEETAAILADAGLEVDDVLEFIGQITGTAAPDRIGPLRSVKGVAAVEESRVVRHAPPGSTTQ